MRCDQHDYLEIACTYRLHVRLALRSGERVEGLAVDTGYSADRRECLVLAQAGVRLELPMAELVWMEQVDGQQYFERVVFG